MPASRTSIALATCQGARFLAQQLESYLQQTRLPEEVVISDDLSTDDTAEISEDFRRRAPFPVRFVSNRGPHGISKNFENAVVHNQFELIIRQRIPAGYGMAFRRDLIPFLVPFSERCFHERKK